MRYLGFVAACLMVVSRAALGAPASCTIEQATGQVIGADIERRSRVAKISIPLIEELKSITAKAKDRAKPIGGQISPGDTARFSMITQQLQQMQLSALVESDRARDASVVQDMFVAARKSYVNPAYVPAKSDIPAIALIAMRGMMPKLTSWSPSSDTDCTIGAALSREEGAVLQRATALTPLVQRDAAVIDQLRRRYGVVEGEQIDTSRMAPEDARTVETLQIEVQPAMREITLGLDVDHIRKWWAASDIVYSSRRGDIATYASPDHVDDTLNAQMPGLTSEQRGLISVWRSIDGLVWSDERRQLDAIMKANSQRP